jgi:glycosyltransferase involved in cell wall biosynthesis
MKRLLYLTTRLFWRPNSGHEVALYNYCKYLHEQLGYEIHTYSFLGPGQSLELYSPPNFIATTQVATKPSGFEVVKNLVAAMPRSDTPLQSALYLSRANEGFLRSKMQELRPDAVIVDMIRLAPYISALNDHRGPKILGLDDLLSKRYQRQLSTDGKGELFGNYAGSGDGLARKVGTLRFAREALLRCESKRAGVAEKRLAARYDALFVVSRTEADELNASTGLGNAYATGMGVDIDYFSEEVSVVDEPGTVSFVGNLSYGPNVDSLRYLRDQVLPRIQTPVRLKVIGQCPDAVRSEFAQETRIELLGRVEDLRPVVRGTSLFLAPIAYGTGVKTKIVEAMAMGMCVVTNSVGAESIDVRDGVEIVIEDDPGEMARHVDRLLSSPVVRQEVGQAAQCFAEERCRWEKSLTCFQEMGL